MENEVVVELLNGMPVSIFLKWFILAMAGAFTFLLIRIFIALGPEKLTKSKQEKWSWRHFFRGVLLLLITLVVVPWIILYFDIVAPKIFEFIFVMGSTNTAGAEHQGITMELNGLSAWLLGFCMDIIVRRAVKKYFKRNE
jgi:hypothetical protein